MQKTNNPMSEPMGPSSQDKRFCLLFCGLLLAYKRSLRPADCIQMMGLPSKFARLVSA